MTEQVEVNQLKSDVRQLLIRVSRLEAEKKRCLECPENATALKEKLKYFRSDNTMLEQQRDELKEENEQLKLEITDKNRWLNRMLTELSELKDDGEI